MAGARLLKNGRLRASLILAVQAAMKRLLAGCRKTRLWRNTPRSATCHVGFRIARRMRKKAVQQGRSNARRRGVPLRYVEPRFDARTPLADFFRILLERSSAESSHL